MHDPTVPSLRTQAHRVLVACDADRKAALGADATLDLPTGRDDVRGGDDGIPGRPDRPRLVPHTVLKPRSVATRDGHVALVHAIAHIELNAIDLAADAAWRFGGMPDDFYRDWTRVMQEEALHFALLAAHLRSLGAAYGDLPAHRALWDMAERTKHDVLARVALVPRTLEARGLDASPMVRAKLASIADARGAAIIDRILADEVGHVAIGNRWFRWLCDERGLEPLATYAALARDHGAPRPRRPFNREARRRAGFADAELDALDDAARVVDVSPPRKMPHA